MISMNLLLARHYPVFCTTFCDVDVHLRVRMRCGFYEHDVVGDVFKAGGAASCLA